jgi:hypothetical protein
VRWVTRLLYTLDMDVVRFGRALGFGARQAAKTVVAAVDAATTEDPRKRSSPSTAGGPLQAVRPETTDSRSRVRSSAVPATAKAAHALAQTVAKSRDTKEALKRGRKRFGEATLEPVVRLSGVLGLEIAGVFFGLFSFGGIMAAWRLRTQWHTGSAGHSQLLGALGMMVLFGYFSISSFIRARRRERGRP